MIKIAVIEDELLHLLQVIADICSFDPEGNDVSILPVLVKPESPAAVETEMAQVRETLESVLPGGQKLKFPPIDQSLGLIDFAQPAEKVRLLSHLKALNVDVILSDCAMGPDQAGVELLDAASADPWIKEAQWQCWLMTQFPDLQQMLRNTQKFLNFDPYTHSLDKSLMLENATGECATKLEDILKSALQARKEREQQIEPDYWFRSAYLHEQFKKNAGKSSPVVIVGPIGTRKESAAQSLHAHSDRRSGPFISFSCGDDSKKDIEWKLFGHNDQEGIVEQARGGTLFLDDINELPSDVQSSLLRVLKAGSVRRVGLGEQERPLDFRLVATTSQVLDRGGLRKDLYNFLRDGKIEISPLHERKGDLHLLVEEFLRENKPGVASRVSPAVMKILNQWSWPGNDLELQQTIERARSQCNGGAIDAQCPVIREIHRDSGLVKYQTGEQIWGDIVDQGHSRDLNAWRNLIGVGRTLELVEFAGRQFGLTFPPKEVVAKYFGGMSYNQFKLTLRYLRFQLWKEQLKERHRQTRGQTRRMWEQIFGWQVIVPVIATLIGIAFAIGPAATSKSEFRIVKALLAISFILLLAKSVHWIRQQKSHFLMRMIVGCFVFGLLSISSVFSWRWVDSRQLAYNGGQGVGNDGIISESIELAKKIGQMSQKWEQRIQPIRDTYSASEAIPEAWANDPEVLILSKEIVGLYEANYKAKAIEARNKLLEKLKPAVIDVGAEFEDAPDTPLHVKASNYKLIAAELERLAAEVKKQFAQR